MHIEFCGDSPYSKDADAFVRLSCREHAGWRRDEWAYSPLFIWGEFSRNTGAADGGIGFVLLDLAGSGPARQRWR
jgi:hypothetical protein